MTFSLSVLHAGVATHLNSAGSFSCEVSPQYLHFCSCLPFGWSAGTPRTETCVCTDRPVYMSGGAMLLSFVPPSPLAPFHRLPLTTLSHESCLCTWRLTCLWTDVRIFLHLCIFGTCRWDSFKDLRTWLVAGTAFSARLERPQFCLGTSSSFRALWIFGILSLPCMISEISTTLSMN